MNDHLILAALCKARFSETVLSAMGSKGAWSEVFWSNPHVLPVPYANGVTLGGAAHTSAHVSAIRELLSGRPAGASTYVEDSWSALDLSPLGFKVAFRDPLLYRPPSPMPAAPPPGLAVERVRTPEALSEFEAASKEGFDENENFSRPGLRRFWDTLLTDGRLTFLSGRAGGRVVAGAVAFSNGDICAVHSLFTLSDHRGRGYGTEMARRATLAYPHLPACTNNSEMSERIFRRLGYSVIGQRALWVHGSE
jgi:GNAT superfamily N-acetyltransferase